jgi:hypothetical protein
MYGSTLGSGYVTNSKSSNITLRTKDMVTGGEVSPEDILQAV